jgi:hypothetical protein
MKKWRLIFPFLVVLAGSVYGQGLEIVDKQDSYQAAISETLQIPVRLRNSSDKPQTVIIRKAPSEHDGFQKGYFCLGRNCMEQAVNEFVRRIEPGEILDLYYTLETGLVTGAANLRFEISTKGVPHIIDHDINVQIEEKREVAFVFQSRDITIHDVYPNPVVDQAFIDYKIHNEAVKARVVIHNILGRTMNETDLPVYESKIKLQTEELATGIYFYTLYLDNDGVLTRKLIVRK